MQISEELRPLFSYSPLSILFFLILIIISIYYLLKKDSNEEQPPVIKEPVKDKESIKKRFLKEIDLLKSQTKNNEISSRKSYQRLSKIIRNFIYEMTSIKVQTYTLEEIKKLNLQSLTELVSEYYDPEFSKISSGNIINSIEKTRQVIISWK